MRCSISFPPAPKRSYINRLVIPAKDFPAAALLSMRSNVLSNAASFLNAHAVQYGLFLYRAAVPWSLVPSVSKFVHATVSNTARRSIGQLVWDHAIATQCLVKNVPPASRSIVHAICKFLQSGSNLGRMTCFWWQLTHDIADHIIRLPLKKCCFEINVKKIPTFAGCHLSHLGSCSCCFSTSGHTTFQHVSGLIVDSFLGLRLVHCWYH